MWTNVSILWETVIEEYLHKVEELTYMQTLHVMM
jgi:hypothetical protein